MNIEETRLLWGAMAFVSLKHALEPEDVRSERPLGPYEPDDGKKMWGVICTIRGSYSAKKLECRTGGAKPNFQQLKSKALALLVKEGLSGERRNFYSSVIATFFSWQHHGTPEKRQRILDALVSLPNPPLPNDAEQTQSAAA